MKKNLIVIFVWGIVSTVRPMTTTVPAEQNIEIERLYQEELIKTWKQEALELVRQNRKVESEEKFIASAILGDAEAQFIVGNMHLKNNSVPDAKRLYKLSSQQHYAAAQIALMNMKDPSLQYQNLQIIASNTQSSDSHYISISELDSSDISHSSSVDNASKLLPESSTTVKQLYHKQLIHTLKKKGLELLGHNEQKQSEEKFTTAALLGDAESQFILGNIYLHRGNYSAAGRLYKLATEQNHLSAQMALLNLNNSAPHEKTSDAPNAQSAEVSTSAYGLLPLSRKSSDPKNPASTISSPAQPSPPSADLDIKDLLKKALKNELDGNRNEAKRLYELAADQGNAFAQCNLGVLYKDEGDRENAKRMFQVASIKGNASAQYNLGVLYEEEGDRNEAKRLFHLAADRGYDYAQCNLGVLYKNEGDRENAKRLFQVASIKGNASAQYNLGVLHAEEGDRNEAKRLFHLAADQGHEFAQYNLGVIYAKEGNKEKAKLFYKLAADQGNLKADNKLKALEKKGTLRDFFSKSSQSKK